MSERISLSSILHQSGTETLIKAWNETTAATDFSPIPAGTYECRLASGELFQARKGTPGYKMTFRVLDGEQAGRLVFHNLWLTPAALPMAKRDLAKIAITDPRQLEDPVPPGLRCKVRVALREDDDHNEYNEVRDFELIAWDKTDDPDFAPADTPAPGALVDPDTEDPEDEGDLF